MAICVKLTARYKKLLLVRGTARPSQNQVVVGWLGDVMIRASDL